MPLIPTPRRELLAAGATPTQLNCDLRAGRSVALLRGVHVDATAVGCLMVRIRAAVATQALTAAVGMQTSSVLHQLRWLPAAWSAPDATIHFAVDPDDKRRDRPGVKLHRRQLTPSDITVVDGVVCLSVTRTLVELARDPELPPVLVVQILDGALRDGRTTKDELFACLGRLSGQGTARARKLVERARESVDSPQETKTRFLLEDGGITDLDVNITIEDDEGFVLARGDLGIKRLLIWGEYDGFVTHSQRDVFRSDRVGDRWLVRRGWNVIRLTDDDLARPARLVREWWAAIADAPARIKALDPRRSPEIAAARALLGFD